MLSVVSRVDYVWKIVVYRQIGYPAKHKATCRLGLLLCV